MCVTFVLVCGDRYWTDKEAIRRELSRFRPSETVLIHGAARGADKLAGKVAEELGFLQVMPVEADWDSFGKAAGPIRNREMLKMQPDVVLAFHADLANSKGTKNMVAIARKAGIPTEVFTT